ncbi:MAG: MBL fold metallo-hydrolase [Bacteroidales bacterium]|nr:MBL fold metallo-hydrolase [Bacteroidales bacterium]
MMKIEQFVCNPFSENTYVVTDEETLQCAIIDPGMCSSLEWAKVRDYIRNNNTVQHILLTHSHVDHLLGAGYCTQEYGVEVSGSMTDQTHLPDARWQAGAFGVDCELRPAAITRNLAEGDTFLLGNLEVQVIDCPGHSFAGLCYYIPREGCLFTGDVLFCGSVGRSDFGEFMGCNGRLLAEGIVQKLFALPAETLVYPGHGPSTSIGYERDNNFYL